jgi:hypothetical protein
MRDLAYFIYSLIQTEFLVAYVWSKIDFPIARRHAQAWFRFPWWIWSLVSVPWQAPASLLNFSCLCFLSPELILPVIFQCAPASVWARLLHNHFLVPGTESLFVTQLGLLADFLLESSIARGGRPVSFSIPLVHAQGSIFPPPPLVAGSPHR